MPNRVKFSAHDVTARLRELVLQSGVIGAVYPIDIAETGTVMVQGQRVARIEHNDVRHIVHTLFEQGAFPAYEQIDNGTFFEYVSTFDTLGVTTGRLSSNQPGTSIPRADDEDPIGPNTGPWSVIS